MFGWRLRRAAGIVPEVGGDSVGANQVWRATACHCAQVRIRARKNGFGATTKWRCQSELGDTAFAGTGFRGEAVLGAGALVFGGLYGSVRPGTKMATFHSSNVGQMRCRVSVPSGLETISVLPLLPPVYFQSY